MVSSIVLFSFAENQKYELSFYKRRMYLLSALFSTMQPAGKWYSQLPGTSGAEDTVGSNRYTSPPN